MKNLIHSSNQKRLRTFFMPLKKHLGTGMMFALTVSLITGCGRQAYRVTDLVQSQVSPGTYGVAPKVDILIAEDDTGSRFTIQNELAAQLPEFLKELDQKNWDYHFVSIPLNQTSLPISEVIASRHDSNWGDQWTPPFPGAVRNAPGTLNASFFRKPENYTGFLNSQAISNSANGFENGLESIRTALSSRLNTSGFLRPDALLVVLVIGNGNDTSSVAYCERPWDRIAVPCETLGTAASSARVLQTGKTLAESLEHYKQELLRLKGNRMPLVKFFSAVAKKSVSNCLGGYARTGTRYLQMSDFFNGVGVGSTDICTNSVADVLTSLSEQLNAEKKNYRTRYLFISQDADPTTIKVTRYFGGDPNNAVEIPQDDENGWSYVGYVQNVYAIDYPLQTQLSSGYAIELHGNAKLVGDDRADVTFKPAGAVDSASK
jgi:hypothetical protein